MFPLIPLLALIALFGGGVTLAWYESLSQQQQQEANRIACDYAKRIFNKTLEELTNEEAKRVAQLTQRHFQN